MIQPGTPFLFDGFIWKLVADKDTCFIHRFDEAVLRKPEEDAASVWPEDAYAVVDSEHGVRGITLTDCLWNTAGRLLISTRLKIALKKAGVTDIEFLPFRVIDRTGMELDPTYYVAYFRNSPDCLNLEACGAKRSRAIPSKAESLQRLVFKSDPGKSLFRPATYNKVILISRALAERLAQDGYTGMRFMGLFDFGLKGDLPPHPERRAVDQLCKRLWENAHPAA